MFENKKLFLISILYFTFYFCFIIVYSNLKTSWLNKEMMKHADVIKKDIWTIDYDGPTNYLKLASEKNSYEKIQIIETTGRTILSINGQKLKYIDYYLNKVGFFPSKKIEQSIIYKKQHIAKLIITHRNKNVYVYLYTFLLILLFYAVTYLFQKVNKTKLSLEENVRKRTSELEEKIFEKHMLTLELLNLRNYLTNIINSMPSIIIGVDSNCIITQWNIEAEKISKISAFQAINKYLFDIFPEFSFQEKNIKDSIFSGEIYTEFDRPRVIDEKEIYENIIIYPLKDDEVNGAVIRIDNVTKEHLLVEQLHQSRKMDAIGQLAGGIAHDFNNMLAGISGAAQLIKNKNSTVNNDNKKYLDIIFKSVSNAADLTKKLLKFSRKEQIKLAPVDVNSAIGETLEIFKRTFDKKIIIQFEKSSDILTVHDNNSALQNIILNLGINASHAMKEGGDLIIKTESIFLDDFFCESNSFDLKSGTYVKIEVKDTGHGISKINIQKIFNPFFTTKEKGKGTGLGLASVYTSIKDINGSIDVESKENIGTIFNIYLPLVENDIIIKDISVDNYHRSETILIVDDEEAIRITLKQILEDNGHKIYLAENGKTAVDLYKKKHKEINCVILDMIMPEMNGIDALKEIRKVDINCNIIIASGFINEENQKKLEKVSISGILQKPFKKSELLSILKNIFEKNLRN